MRKLITILGMTILMTAAACKKDKGGDSGGAGAGTAAGSGTAAGTAAGTGDTMAGSGAGTAAGTGDTMAGSGAGSGDTAGGGDRPASITDDDVATLDKAKTAGEKLVADLTAAGTDCKKAAGVFSEATPTFKEFGPIMKKLMADKAAADWVQAQYKNEAMEKQMMDLVKACAKDKDFTKATTEFGKAMAGM